MRTAKVDVPTEDGTADSYLAVPDGGPAPRGAAVPGRVRAAAPVSRKMANRIAERGYAVLAPNPALPRRPGGGHRPGRLEDPEKRGAIFGKIMPLIQALDTAAITRDAEAYLDFFAAQEGVDRARW